MKVLIAFCLAVIGLSTAAHADSITYTFTGSDGLAGTHFTYVSSNGFLAFDTGLLAPTTTAGLYVSQGQEQHQGPLLFFDFNYATIYALYFRNPADLYFGPDPIGVSETVYQSPYNLNTIGIQNLGQATLDIELTNPPTAVTPEPSSLILLGTGAIGILGTARRRHLRT